MSAPNSQIQWYLAREGKQYGPLSELELSKFVELGHLLPTDLLWREGFTDWRPAPSVFPPKSAAPRPAPAPARAAPAAARQPSMAEQAAAAWPRGGEPAARAASADQQRQAGGYTAAQPAAQRQPSMQRQQGRGPAQQPEPGQLDPQFGFGHAERKKIDPAEFDDDADFQPGGQVLRKALTVVALLAVIAGAGYGAYTFRSQIMGIAGLAGSERKQAVPVIVSDRKLLDVPPLKGLQGTPEEIDGNLQQTALWRVIKREFPEWYVEQIKSTSDLSARNTDKAEVAQKMAQALVLLRRQQLNNALSASVPRLRLVASSFFENLAELRKTSDVACFEFIARGEASPLVVTMLQGSPHVPRLQAQMTAVYEAIADGRKTPRAYPAPKREDYEKLALDLQQQRGWTQADLQLFTNERALSQATPGKVCQLVHDWFAAQLDIKDADMQVRLLVDSLKPVVAG